MKPLRFRNKLRLTPTLTMVIGAFVFLTAALVLAVQTIKSEQILRGLGAEYVKNTMQALGSEFSEHMGAVEEQTQFAARAIANGSILLNDEEELTGFLYGTLAAIPQAALALVITPDGHHLQVDRGVETDVLMSKRGKTDPGNDLTELAKQAQKTGSGFWTKVEYVPALQYSYVAYVMPIMDGDTYLGLVLTGVSLRELSDITGDLSTGQITVFLLYDNGHLLAHPNLGAAPQTLTYKEPLLRVDQSPDDFLAAYSVHETFESKDILPASMTVTVGQGTDGSSRFMVTDDTDKLFGGQAVKLGAHFPTSILEQPFEQLYEAIFIGIALLGIALVGTGVLSHYIALPIQRAAAGARAVASLELDRMHELPGSSIRELNDLAAGFNSMVGGLSAFMRYMPRSLVTKLVREGLNEARPEVRDLAVLFTDIAGYTHISEGMSASETADFVNQHLSLIGSEISKHGGTIDKYIGDSVMAFWGAPVSLDTPAVPAALAALDIARAIQADNKIRVAQGLPPVRIRIGVHCGPLVVGDIGAPDRVNYTVIGDTVNAASRLESLGREIDPEAEVCVLVSQEIAASLPEDISQEALGSRAVKGRKEALNVVRLRP